MAKITKDTVIAEVLMMNRGTAPIFIKHGLHCLGCAGANMESINDAAKVHEVDVDTLVNDLNEYLENQGE
ncbi:DUF1858 domain-containing protein [Paramaledivibacter caminithermalis]|jgi:hybrid cluster-associated redox disulfide protein|uniref:Hybrid cluster protein-associated redox disulfide domain-containing protein n=1 Tax=Paramaledivibacter caminithermalis (strain DSM 15212 / CIP 107654 / DViRD3) TaxID=1121301 RepID=A0A1M6NCG5_PARC5|nr:DUF1858 domain-containing protein [Paramaledivibacter caminithermalis]SHJ93410.1 hybrid cluster protein-associated redox disulfide domain-containing protein [Paramaledivibacter caminithermalis DSM 15212]